MSIRFRLMTRDDIPAGMRLKDAAGWNQIVPDWERFLAASPQGCFAAECDGRLLGPWMARNEDVAVTLLDEFLHRSGRDLVYVDCVRRNPWAVPLVRLRGFELSRPLTRMFRGTNTFPGDPQLLCAILGPEFG